jgi:fluoroacetyl-CoA thioesterase
VQEHDDRTLEPGATGELEWRVGAPDLASALSREPWHDFPAVFATHRMIALMELAATKALRTLYREGEMSVGVSVEVSHVAPTPPGSVVNVTATFLRREGKLFVFDVAAEDEGGRIGHGIHKRAIISIDRLIDGAKRRVVR